MYRLPVYLPQVWVINIIPGELLILDSPSIIQDSHFYSAYSCQYIPLWQWGYDPHPVNILRSFPITLSYLTYDAVDNTLATSGHL